MRTRVRIVLSGSWSCNIQGSISREIRGGGPPEEVGHQRRGSPEGGRGVPGSAIYL